MRTLKCAAVTTAVCLCFSPHAFAQSAPAAPSARAPQAAVPEVSDSDARLTALMDLASGLTSMEVARRAVDTSFRVRIKAHAVAGSEAKYETTRDAFYPKLTGTARYSRLSDVPGFSLGPPGLGYAMTTLPQGTPIPPNGSVSSGPIAAFPVPLNQYLAQAQVAVPLSDYVLRLSKALAAATNSARAARVDAQAERLQVALDAKLAYYNWIRANGQYIVAQQSVEQAKGHVTDARRAFEVGLSSKADVMRAESASKTMELFAERSGNMASLADQSLRVTMHDASGRPYKVGENIFGDLPPLADADSLEPLVREAFDKRLEIRALDATKAAISSQVEVAHAGKLPRLDAIGTVAYANPNPRVFPQEEKFRGSWDASFVLTWTPTDIPGIGAQQRELEEKDLELDAQKSALRDMLRFEVTQSWQAYKESEVALATSHAGLRASEESYRVRRDLYNNGKATLVEVTDAYSDLTRARLEAINARIDTRTTRERLLHSAGRDATP